MSIQEIRIKNDGKWYADDREMFRKPIVNLFATHLEKDEIGGYYIQLEKETYPVLVDDVPFTVVNAAIVDGAIVFVFHDEQEIRLDTKTLLSFTGDTPYLSFRWENDTRLNRSVFWMISRYLEENGDQVFLVPPNWETGCGK
ncbi:MAG: DUF1285 domain-containing protein [Syntrophomonadaceae bacterium]|nr:DUF1285 domain-containing protein [Syntrophomonadaceae bacterium]